MDGKVDKSPVGSMPSSSNRTLVGNLLHGGTNIQFYLVCIHDSHKKYLILKIR